MIMTVWRWLITVCLAWSLCLQPAAAQWGTTNLPLVGERAPTFTLTDQQGGLRSLDDFHGQWVVLYFYPKDFTSGCTLEARRFQQDLDRYQALHTQIIGVSADTVERHNQFCASEKLGFALLSDPEGLVSQRYGSWLGDVALRNTFLIDPDGVLREIFPIVSPARHSQEVLGKLEELQALG
ncbi:MAG: peroxiredoxin [Synechococcales cyanobacterium]